MSSCLRVGVQKGGHHAGHLQAHADVGEEEASGQGDTLHRDVETGECEEDHHQAEVHVVERVLELAQVVRLFEHPQPDLQNFHLGYKVDR